MLRQTVVFCSTLHYSAFLNLRLAERVSRCAVLRISVSRCSMPHGLFPLQLGRSVLECFAMRVICVSSAKGGVGKSAVGTALAVGIARSKRAVLIDADFSRGDATFNLGVRWNDPRNDEGEGLARALLGRTAIPLHDATWVEPDAENPVTFERTGLRLAVGGTKLQPVFTAMVRGELDVATAFRQVRDIDADVVVIDTPPLGLQMQQAVFAVADDVIPLLQPDRNAMRGLNDIVRVIADVRRINPGLRLAGVPLYPMPKAWSATQREWAADANEALNGVAPLFRTVVRHSVEYSRAVDAGLVATEWAQYLRVTAGFSVAKSATALAWDFEQLLDEVIATW